MDYDNCCFCDYHSIVHLVHADLLDSDMRELSLQMCTWHPLSAPPPTPTTERYHEDTGLQYKSSYSYASYGPT